MITAAAFLVAAALGAVGRALLREAAPPVRDLPLGTLTANLAGCLVLGTISHWSAPAATVAGTAGLGALTTFSTFAAEIVDLGRSHRPTAIAYATGSVIAGIGAAHLGMQLVA